MSMGMIGVAFVGYMFQSSENQKNRDAAQTLADDASAAQEIQQAKLDKQIAEYKKLQFKNPYENMENVYEDLTVNQQQAQFQTEQAAQQRANVMQSLRGAAGGSGIAGLAQSLANQGALQTQRISASIGQQEAANQKLAAKGAYQVEMAERGGEQIKQQWEMDRESTILGMQYGVSAGANAAAQAADLNKLQVDAAAGMADAQMLGNIAGAVVGGGTSGRQIDPNLTNQEQVDINDPNFKPFNTANEPVLHDVRDVNGKMERWNGSAWVTL